MKEEKLKKKLNARLELAKFLRETIAEMAKRNKPDTGKGKQFSNYLHEVGRQPWQRHTFRAAAWGREQVICTRILGTEQLSVLVPAHPAVRALLTGIPSLAGNTFHPLELPVATQLTVSL